MIFQYVNIKNYIASTKRISLWEGELWDAYKCVRDIRAHLQHVNQSQQSWECINIKILSKQNLVTRQPFFIKIKKKNWEI